MKKIFMFMAIVSLMMSTSCKPKQDAFLKQAKSDYETVVKETPDSVFTALYEIETVLNKYITETDELEIAKSLTVIQVGDSVKTIDRDENTERVEYLSGHWGGDYKIRLDSVKVGFNEAVKLLKKSGLELPETNFMTFRAPMTPPFQPFYVFGSHKTFFVAVNAVTGEIDTYSDRMVLGGIRSDEELDEETE